jgi:hypothetical protein
MCDFSRSVLPLESWVTDSHLSTNDEDPLVKKERSLFFAAAFLAATAFLGIAAQANAGTAPVGPAISSPQQAATPSPAPT